MKRNDIIETIGNIDKTENLISIEDNIIKSTLVLKTKNPFPGVDSARGTSEKPVSYFIVLRQKYEPEIINRIISKLYHNWNLLRYPSYTEISLNNSGHSSIRVKELKTPLHIITIQQCLESEGLQLAAYKPFDGLCSIKIFKSFKISEVANNIYRDMQDREKFYLRLHITLAREKFDNITSRVKQRISDGSFDAAMGTIYRFTGTENVIRIYDKDVSEQRAAMLQKLYMNEIRKETLLNPTLFL